MGRRGVSTLISAAFYLAVIIVSVGLVVQVAEPTLNRVRDTGAIQNHITFFNDLDEVIRTVAAEGSESSRVVTHSFRRGRLGFNRSTDAVYYAIDTRSQIVSPGRSTDIGAATLSAANRTGTRRVQAALTYDSIHLHGFDRELPPGTYTLLITNAGTTNGEVNITLAVQ